MPPAKLLLDIMSQPSRAILIFCRAAEVPHEFVPTSIAKGEHKADEFTKMQPLATVPLVMDGDVPIRDSNAAVRYLTKKYGVADHWYPQDPEGQARVDEYLHWQHLNTRLHGSLYFQKLFIIPMMKTGKPSDDEKLRERLKKNVDGVLDNIEKVFLANGMNKYIAGGDKISAADIWACCELEQPLAAGYDVCDDRPVLSEYMSRIRQELNPHYDDCHKVLFKIAKKNFNKSRL